MSLIPKLPNDPFRDARVPHNLGITRELALTVCVVSLVLAVCGLTFAMETGTLDEKSTAAVTSLLTTFGVLLMSLVGALKSTEAADTASKASTVVKHLAEAVKEVTDGHTHDPETGLQQGPPGRASTHDQTT